MNVALRGWKIQRRGRRRGLMGTAGGVGDFVLNLRSDLLVAAMVICGSWTPWAKGEGKDEMSLAIPRRDTGHATAPLKPPPSPSDVHRDTPPPPETPRLSSREGEGWCTQKNVRGRTFTTSAERIALTREKPACPSRSGILADRARK